MSLLFSFSHVIWETDSPQWSSGRYESVGLLLLWHEALKIAGRFMESIAGICRHAQHAVVHSAFTKLFVQQDR